MSHIKTKLGKEKEIYEFIKFMKFMKIEKFMKIYEIYERERDLETRC